MKQTGTIEAFDASGKSICRVTWDGDRRRRPVLYSTRACIASHAVIDYPGRPLKTVPLGGRALISGDNFKFRISAT